MDDKYKYLKNRCFFVAPIGNPASDARKRTDLLFRSLREIVENKFNLEWIVAHQMDIGGSMSKAIIDEIRTAKLVIVDITERNPNVMYELGWRHALGLPVIHIAEEKTTLPFDIQDFNTIFYQTSDIEAFKQKLRKMINSIFEGREAKLSFMQNHFAVLLNDHDEIALIDSICDRKGHVNPKVVIFYEALVSNIANGPDDRVDPTSTERQRAKLLWEKYKGNKIL